MADYGDDQQGAYDAVEAAGGKITFNYSPPPLDDGPNFWEGDDTPSPNINHIAVLVPFSNISSRGAKPFAQQAIIPALNLPFAVIKGTRFVTEANVSYTVENVDCIRPDGVQAIVYICEVEEWAGT